MLLTPEDADHTVTLSPDGHAFADAYSTPTTPPVTLLRNADTGATIATIARADITRLQAAGWTPPTPITVKARDGRTELYGLMFKPSQFDPTKKYPIVDYIYPGPQTGSVGSRSFSAARGDHQALAELGFVVVAIDGMGTPWRSKSFHDAYYGDIGDNTLPDQVAAHEASWAGAIRGSTSTASASGAIPAAATPPPTRCSAIPISSRSASARAATTTTATTRTTGARSGRACETARKDGPATTTRRRTRTAPQNLKGHLLLAHGTMDDNVPPSNTLLVVDALVKANRDRRQRQSGGERTVHRHREVGTVGGDERQDVAAPRTAGPQPGGEGAHPLGELAVGDRAPRRRVDHGQPLGPVPRARQRLLVQQPRREVEVVVAVSPKGRVVHRRSLAIMQGTCAHLRRIPALCQGAPC